ncbi:hypothetical protein ASO20_00375 [Mycoplasma sp. (ex Biomphalaria glabrata)]|uniref:hypothetical protein n=1 Tax=Mycoplasma sp. (ex Biomphalaria glabrata) TaxID=1749074 RepID=UPI00073AE078|nr:hypothetical protein [Mycoplasma sp. (ex Biomphalaria glabrata)]ALV23137.1 hypothetical protein ASO20_00375 [Mycoplasma sp. (ex Biomphalaria glabrata)]
MENKDFLTPEQKKELEEKEEQLNNENVNTQDDDLNYLNIYEKIEISKEKLTNKRYLAWRYRKIIWTALTWLLLIAVLSSVILGVGYSKNHRLVNFDYDFSGTTQIAITDEADLQNLAKNHNAALKDEKITNADELWKQYQITSEANFIKAIAQVHDDVNEYCEQNHILYQDNWNSIDNSWVNPYALGLNTQTDISQFLPHQNPIPNPQNQVHFYFVRVNIGINDAATDLRSTLKQTDVKALNNIVLKSYQTHIAQYFDPTTHVTPPNLQDLQPYSPKWDSLQKGITSNTDTFYKNWILTNNNQFYFMWQEQSAGMSLVSELTTLFISFIVAATIGVIYLNIRHKMGNGIAMYLSTLGFVIMSGALLLPSSIAVSATSIIILFFTFILMIINFLGIVPDFMRYRKQVLESDYREHGIRAGKVYNIIRQIMGKRKLFYISQLLIILIPLLTYSTGIVIDDINKNVPLWITFTYHLSNEIYFFISYLVMWLFFIFVFIPIWAWSQTRSINFWRDFNFKSISRKEKFEEQNFEHINKITKSKYEVFRDKDAQKELAFIEEDFNK